ncbi:MAG: long-chain-acyl-CoA synthetase, partial [Chloroflexi bacterium]|nr:long-chain-acyl-CoA synthetase [Chloroflexota bacterium]
MRALELTASIARHPHRLLADVIDERAAELGDAPALLSDRECLTYFGLVTRMNQYARWALAHGIRKGDCVALLMPNRPDFMAIWLGITRVGGVVALLNTNQRGPSLAHSLNVAAPRHVIVSSELVDALESALPDLATPTSVSIHGAGHNAFHPVDQVLEKFDTARLSETERPPVSIEDRALYIYTSGTTGLPKAASISHGRILQWSHWFAGLMDTRPMDRMYDCLPMYHSVGGVQAPGAVLVGGGSVVLSEKFSSRRFWSDIVRWDCTLFQYIGELCRYLVHTELSPAETQHRVRIACGNGLRADIWEAFKSRFRIPHILEFYGATEGNVSFFNVDGEIGSVGRTPSYLAHRFPSTLVRFDLDKEEPVRDEHGFCIRCGPNEAGEAIGQLSDDRSNFGSKFEGYTSQAASEKKILRHVFKPGDAWFRTGDLMRKDEKGFYYFVDRIGDTFRWKGENVATSEVAEAICAFPGIQQANVYGVSLPGADGRAGMAALVTDDDLDLGALRQHLGNQLPEYARPVFLRVATNMAVTSTFKYTKTDLVREAYNPASTSDAIYF